MRILSDFDGVFTTQEAEAAAVGERELEIVCEALGDAVRGRALVEGLRAEVRADPVRNGWLSGGEISCYGDEDPYAFNNAVAAALYARAPADAVERLRAAGLATADHLAARAWDEGQARYRAAHPSHVLPEAIEALSVLGAAGIEVVIVSNSETDRIQALLQAAGMGRFGQAKPRVRGGAKKFVLGPEPRALPAEAAFGARPVRVRRPHYHRILVEEQPDVVLGDVFSLDLALPAYLRESEDALEDTTLILAKHASTPAWTLEACAAKGVEVVDSIRDVPRLIRV